MIIQIICFELKSVNFFFFLLICVSYVPVFMHFTSNAKFVDLQTHVWLHHFCPGLLSIKVAEF